MVSYSSVSELPGEMVPAEQIQRFRERYLWASSLVSGKSVLECACGAGQGIQLLKESATSIQAGDFDESQVQRAKKTYPDVEIQAFDACNMPFEDASFDAILIAEAIYYLPSIGDFFKECKRVLKTGGLILVVTANKDLYDFNPSPFTHTYPGVLEISQLFKDHNLEFVSAEAGTSLDKVKWRQKALRPIKFIAARMGMIPGSMGGKSFLKKVFFGNDFYPMPDKITGDDSTLSLEKVPMTSPCLTHKVLYFTGRKN
jgi:ubiquinone/menaquinone biosynthesis C-methylase UbiE